MENEHDAVAIAANISAVLYQALKDVSWVGFYFYKNNELILGPFQGKLAYMHIPLHKGVCGAAASNKKTYIVPDVHAFKGHIACDSEAASEIVIPLLLENSLYGVLDIDSISKNRFTTLDAQHLVRLPYFTVH